MTTPITPEEIAPLYDIANDSGCEWANALADKIEAMQAENAALKKRIEESAREFDWYLDEAGVWCLHAFGARATIYQNGIRWYWSVFDDKPKGGLVDRLIDAFEAARIALLETGIVRPIDTISHDPCGNPLQPLPRGAGSLRWVQAPKFENQRHRIHGQTRETCADLDGGLHVAMNDKTLLINNPEIVGFPDTGGRR